MPVASNCISFEGANFLRQRLVLSTLSGKAVKIKKIRSQAQEPGINEWESSFIRLIDKITNGSRIEVNETGTALYYQPGLLTGGDIQHDCNVGRGLGYFLEALIQLAPFGKERLSVRLRGVTNNQVDPSVDSIKASSIPVLAKFLGSDDGLELKILRRGAPPGGGGEVLFNCPCKPKLRPVNALQQGKVKRIRGVAYAMRVSPQFANRMVDSAKSLLNKCVPDVYIYTDHMKGPQSGKSPGFGLCLVAETNEGVFFSAEASSNPKRGEEDGTPLQEPDSRFAPSIPEDVGLEAAKLLLDEVARGGCVDSLNQATAALFMALGQADVSKLLTGELTEYAIHFLRHMKTFLKVTFLIDEAKLASGKEEEEEERTGEQKLILTCVGIGYKNLSKTHS